jgi:uncharacterized protein involved in outer membrane biogenesis
VIAVLAIMVAGAVAVMHTSWGREIIRTRIERQLQATLIGGGRLGHVEGSPLGELILHDLVLNGPDGQPAISVKTLAIDLRFVPLLSRQVHISGLTAEDVDIDLRRDDRGDLQIQHLTRPGPKSPPKSTWSVALPKVAIRRAHVRFDTGTDQMNDETNDEMNFDGLALDARAVLPYEGPIDASFELRGTWRERAAAGLDLRAVVHAGDRGLAVPSLSMRVGDVSARGHEILIGAAEAGQGPVVGGTVTIDAGAAAVARLVPDVQLPADVAVTVTATPVAGRPLTELAITGRIDQTELQVTGTADLAATHVRGEFSTDALDVTKLTGGKVSGSAAASGVFDVRPGGPRALPVATATIRGWGEIAGVPNTTFEIALRSAGERARVWIDATGDGAQVKLAANLRVLGDLLAIEHATLHATASDAARASGGKAPVDGALRADLAASGTLRPAPSLAVSGTIEGRRVRVQDLSVAALHVAIDAERLPHRPLGRARVQLVELVRGDLQLGELSVEAADRVDGKVWVAVRSRPKQSPWLFDADALVTPPGRPGVGTVVVDLLRHHVRAGSGTDWTGRTGHLEIRPARIVLRDLVSASSAGRLALAGSSERAGRRRGDLVANIDAKALSLDDLATAYRGTLDAHVAVARRGGAWQGEVEIDGTQIATGASLDPSAPVPVIDTHVRAALHGTQLTVAADARSPGLGSARLALDLEAPATIADPRAWKRLDRGAIRTADLTLQGIDAGRAAALAGLGGEYAGRIDGAIRASAATTSGRITARNMVAPPLRGLGAVSAVFDLAQTTPTRFTPALVVTAEGIGKISAQAQLELPDRLLDPAAWDLLGRTVLRGASLRTENVAIDPALLARLGVTRKLHGGVGIAVDLGEAGRTMRAAIDITGLRGAPIVQPIDVHLAAETDGRETTTSLSIKAGKAGDATLLAAQGRLPVSVVELAMQRRGAPQVLRATPLAATVKLASADAARLLAVFGRTEVIAGRIDGSIEIGGTLGQPTTNATIVATGLQVPPGPGGKPVRTVERLTVVGRWDGSAAKLDLDGVESDGGTLQVSLAGRPEALHEATLTIKAEKFDLVPLLAFVPGPAGGSAGRLDADLAFTGLDLRTSRITGELHLLDARVPLTPAIGTMRQAKIDAVIADQKVQLSVDGKLGSGSASVTGSVALEGAVPSAGKAKLVLRKVSPIGAVEPQVTADITATLSRVQNQWRAHLAVDDGMVVVPSDRGEALRSVGAPPDMLFASDVRLAGRSRARQAPASPTFLVTIALGSTRVESEEFRGLIRGRLEIRANGRSLGMFGGIEADRGDLDLFGRRYAVERAGVHFDGSLDPLLDIRITHEFPEVITVTEVGGRLSRPELRLTSDPGTYSQAQLLGFLLGGEPGGGDPQSGAATDKVASAGASFVANKIGDYVRKALPIDIDVLRYEAASASSSAAVTVGTWVTRSLFLAYRQRLSARADENTGEGELEYWLARRILLEGTVGNRGYHGIDLLWRRRY